MEKQWRTTKNDQRDEGKWRENKIEQSQEVENRVKWTNLRRQIDLMLTSRLGRQQSIESERVSTSCFPIRQEAEQHKKRISFKLKHYGNETKGKYNLF